MTGEQGNIVCLYLQTSESTILYPYQSSFSGFNRSKFVSYPNNLTADFCLENDVSVKQYLYLFAYAAKHATTSVVYFKRFQQKPGKRIISKKQ